MTSFIKNKIDNDDKLILSNINDNYTLSKKGYNCIGPCYPSNTLFYNPMNLNGYYSKNDSYCPITKVYDETLKKNIFVDKCHKKDISIDYKKYNIFDDTFKIATTKNKFLNQIYNINDINDVINFINDSINLLPIYSQKRIISCIFNVYSKNINLPVNKLTEIILNILEKIYDINIKFTILNKKIINFTNKNKSIDIFDYLISKNKI